MNIFKNNLYDIVKLYINQIGITIFSWFLYFAIPADDDPLFDTLSMVVSIFAILFYLILIYNVVWEIGAKDRIRIDSKGCEPQPLKGMVMALFANLPNLVFAFFAVLFGVLYVAGGIEWASPVFFVFVLIMKSHAAMYMGLVQGITPSVPEGAESAEVFGNALTQSVWFVVLPLVAVALTQLSYWLGTKEFKLFGFLFSGKGKK